MSEILGKTAQSVLTGLESGKAKFGFNGVKAEFEAEGSRLDDLKILLFAGKSAGLETIVKLGGCEALRDMRDLAALGRVENVVAPMVESSFALKKFKAMALRVFHETGFNPKLLFNLETITAWRDFENILEEASRDGSIYGVTFGRGDFAESIGLPRSEVDSLQVREVVLEAALQTKSAGLKFCVGGSITAKSVGLIRELKSMGAHSFESRKVSWNFEEMPDSEDQIVKNINGGLEFEFKWLKAKSQRYLDLANEDAVRLSQLTERFS